MRPDLKLCLKMPCALLWVGVCLSACAPQPARAETLPSPKALAAEFETGAVPWIIKASEPSASRSLQSPARAPWDMRKAGKLTLSAERVKTGGAAARLRWLVTSRVGGLYLGPAVPLPINGAAEPALNFLESAGELTPVGHPRPWDALAAAEVIALELRVETSASAVKNDALEIKLSQVRLEAPRAGEFKPRLLDLALAAPPSNSRAKAVLTFRIDPLPDDPYAPSGAGDVRVKFSDGQQALAFLEQDMVAREDGAAERLLPAGLPYWRAYLPEWHGSGELEISSGESSWRLSAAALEFPKAAAAGSQPAGAASPRLELHARWDAPLEKTSSTTAFESWTGSSTRWILRSSIWEPLLEPLTGTGSAEATRVWRPVPFWNSSWGHYAGARRPDPALAAQMSALLEQSTDARPLIVLEGATLERQGVFNWASHPLRGVLNGPGEIFRSEAGYDFCARSLRYCLARYAHFKSVNALWLTSDLNAPGASEFHARIAVLLGSWRADARGALPVVSFHPLAQPPQNVKSAGTFERLDRSAGALWRADQRLGRTMGRVLENEGLSGAKCFEIRALEPASTSVAAIASYALEASDYRKPADDNFFGCRTLLFDVWIPANAPADLRVGVHLRDRDGEWFQALLPGLLRPGDWSTCAVDLSAANAHRLTPVNSQKVWTDYSRQRISEIGLHIYSVHPNWSVRGMAQTLNARFDNIRGVNLLPLPAPEKTSISIMLADEPDAPHLPPARGELVELNVKLNKAFANPFDPCDCDLSAVVTAPSGKVSRVPLFFNQRCERRELTPGGAEIVEPRGMEFFTLRYRARESGPHGVRFELREGGHYDIAHRWEPDTLFTHEGEGQAGFSRQWPYTQYTHHFPDGRRPVDKVTFVTGTLSAVLDLGKAAFTVGDAPRSFHGFVRTAADRRHFEFEDGTFFYPLGPCLRSPSDSRIPYRSEQFNPQYIDKLGKRGTYQYDEYFEAFANAGINWARVWMCSWWGSLEWRRDWPGYQGLGRYNLLNAWRMDYIVALAEKKGIYLNLALTNHGQFTLNIDTEWKNNPYNAKLGGPLHAPCEIFTRAEGKIAHQNKLRYVAARYGHSPNIMAFALFSELEFTEEYDQSILGMRNNNGVDAPAPHIESWHAEMAGFLKNIDPNKHLISTHFSHPSRGEGTLLVPQIDIATSNAYSAFEELGGQNRANGNMDASAALHDFWTGSDDGAVRGFKIFNKPALVEEQGRHWMGMDGGQETNTKTELDADLHAGLWGSMVLPLSGATGYWWWLHVHFDNRYGDYRALSKFVAGEDFRRAKGEGSLEPVAWSVSKELYGRALKSDRRLYAWIYSPLTPLGDREPPVVSGALLKGAGLKPGKYRVEFWDTYKGERIDALEVTVGTAAASQFAIKLPPVKRDIAVKIKPVE